MPPEFSLLDLKMQDDIAIATLQRADKRNAINDELLNELDMLFSTPPSDARAMILQGAGEHFCAGLDLIERLSRPKRSPFDGVRHSRKWHSVFSKIQHGEIPIVSVLKGGVIGGGLELAAATHVRVAESTSFFQLPEGQRGIFVGGGGSVRIPRIIGAGRMTEMMLTGRKYSALEGQAIGLAHYVVEAGQGLQHAIELAKKIAGNAYLSNYAIINSISRIHDMSVDDGLFTESMVAAITRTSGESEGRIAAFFESRSRQK